VNALTALQIQKKTLSPNWNETFVVTIKDSLKETVKVQVYDYNRIGKACILQLHHVMMSISQHQPMGEAQIALAGLTKGREVVDWIPLSGVPSGQLQIGLKALDFGKRGTSLFTLLFTHRSVFRSVHQYRISCLQQQVQRHTKQSC
jgi:hypothetical protein